MTEPFSSLLAVGGRSNSLGRAGEVLQTVLNDQSRLEELYQCLFEDDAWLRMRAIDTLEKVCRVHPDWLQPYINRFLRDVVLIDQASVKWHLAQLFGETALSSSQRSKAIAFLKQNISQADADWIVASNTMATLVQFVKNGYFSTDELIPLLKIQQTHRSNAVVKRATRFLDQLNREV